MIRKGFYCVWIAGLTSPSTLCRSCLETLLPLLRWLLPDHCRWIWYLQALPPNEINRAYMHWTVWLTSLFSADLVLLGCLQVFMCGAWKHHAAQSISFKPRMAGAGSKSEKLNINSMKGLAFGSNENISQLKSMGMYRDFWTRLASFMSMF